MCVGTGAGQWLHAVACCSMKCEISVGPCVKWYFEADI